MDIQTAKSIAKQTDLIKLIGKDTKLTTASRSHRNYCGPCPFCGGEDRFVVNRVNQTWFCRKCGDGKGKDVIEYVRKKDKLSFVEALEKLTGQTVDRQAGASANANPSSLVTSLATDARSASSMPTASPVEPPSPDWQARHYALVADAEDRLFSNSGQVALDYITSRGILSWTACEACLGYVTDPEPRIIIPHMVKGQLWAVKWRSLVGKMYGLYTGSRLGSPYLADWMQQKRILLITEGELDALMIYGKIADLADVTTLGSATGRLGAQFIPAIREYGLVLVCTDADDAGDKAANYWHSIAGNAYKRLRPTKKDITDMWQAAMMCASGLSERVFVNEQ